MMNEWLHLFGVFSFSFLVLCSWEPQEHARKLIKNQNFVFDGTKKIKKIFAYKNRIV